MSEKKTNKKDAPVTNGKSHASGEHKSEKPKIEKKKRQIQKEVNLEVIEQIKSAIAEGEPFCPGDISRETDIPF